MDLGREQNLILTLENDVLIGEEEQIVKQKEETKKKPKGSLIKVP